MLLLLSAHAVLHAGPAPSGAPHDVDRDLLRSSTEIDLLEAALAVSYDAETAPVPSGDRDRWVRYLQGLRAQLLTRVLTRERTPLSVAREASRVLFGQEGFTIDARWLSGGREADFFLLPRVLSRRQGVPLSLSILLVVLARDAGTPASLVVFPDETFAIFGTGGDEIIVDPDGGGTHPRAWLMGRCPLAQDAPADVYGRALTKREILALLAHAIASWQIEERNLDAARISLMRARRLWPHFPPTYLAMGSIHVRRADMERAELCFRRAVEIDPSEAEGYRWLGEVARQEGSLARAESEFRSAIDKDPRLVEAHLGLGMTLVDAKRLDEAEACFLRAAEIDPGDARAPTGMGLVFLARGMADAAEAALAQAIDLDPACADAYRLRGQLNESLWGDHAAALADFTEAIRLDADDPRARRLRATLYDRTLGRPDQALADYRAFLELAPYDPWAAAAARRIREIVEASGSASRATGS
ncbi:MAG: tetratricopeptide repeat protein [Planctomycetes bacterium]|nr:tetratricopeptide repeat protein [Planctomycetota bacterium]